MTRFDAARPWFACAVNELYFNFAADEMPSSIPFAPQIAFHAVMSRELATKSLLVFESSDSYCDLEGDEKKTASMCHP